MDKVSVDTIVDKVLSSFMNKVASEIEGSMPKELVNTGKSTSVRTQSSPCSTGHGQAHRPPYNKLTSPRYPLMTGTPTNAAPPDWNPYPTGNPAAAGFPYTILDNPEVCSFQLITLMGKAAEADKKKLDVYSNTCLGAIYGNAVYSPADHTELMDKTKAFVLDFAYPLTNDGKLGFALIRQAENLLSGYRSQAYRGQSKQEHSGGYREID